MKRQGRRYVRLILAIVLAVAVVDQVLKTVILQTMEPGEAHRLLGDWLSLKLVFNPGAAFGMGQDATWIFTCVQIIFVIGVAVAAPRLRDPVTATGIAMIGGGALGNLIDRLTREPQFFLGHVVDYVSVKGFSVFNFADASITLGVVVFLLATPLEGRTEEEKEATPGGGADA